MGIYADERYERTNETTLVHTWHIPGFTKKETFTLTEVSEERTDCFCCSCDDSSSDPYCRNHGFAGTRPCELHKMPGTVNDEGVMPESVQVIWKVRNGETAED